MNRLQSSSYIQLRGTSRLRVHLCSLGWPLVFQSPEKEIEEGLRHVLQRYGLRMRMLLGLLVVVWEERMMVEGIMLRHHLDGWNGVNVRSAMQIMNVSMIRLTAEYGKRRDILNIAQMFNGLSTQCFLGFQKLCPAFAFACQSKRGYEHSRIYT